jgi:hypothetical protein
MSSRLRPVDLSHPEADWCNNLHIIITNSMAYLGSENLKVEQKRWMEEIRVVLR